MFSISCKNDPNCQFIQPLSETWCVEDSIDTLNFNFSALDAETCNLLFSATEFIPTVTWFESNSGNILDVLNFVESFSAKIEGASTTVETLSSFWLTPITIIYKDILDVISEPIVTSWINSNFPQKTGDGINYINGQKLYVYNLKYASESKHISVDTVVPGYTYTYNTTVRRIGRTVTVPVTVNVPSRTVKDVIECYDKYIGEVIGFEYCLTNGTWIYQGLIND